MNHNVKCTSHLDRSLQNTGNRNLGFSQHFNKGVILPICKYSIGYLYFQLSLSYYNAMFILKKM